MRHRLRFCLCFLAAAALLLPACRAGADRSSASGTQVFFDTSVTLTIYGEEASAAISECFSICQEMELVFSAQNPDSELSKINRRDPGSGDTSFGRALDADSLSWEFTVSPELAQAIALGLQAWSDTGGLFDITMYPVTSIWDFRSGKGTVPQNDLLSAALLAVDSAQLKLEGNTLTLLSPDTEMDLGAIAKGCISAALKAYLQNRAGVSGAILNLGGNISVFGEKPDKSPWRVGIQKPFSDRGELIATAELREGCVISSGTYERCFTEDGVFYHHILSAETGRPVDSGLSQATVIGTDDALADTLSTVCMLLGKEEAETLILEKAYAVRVLFTLDDGSLILFDPQSGETPVKEGTVLSLE